MQWVTLYLVWRRNKFESIHIWNLYLFYLLTTVVSPQLWAVTLHLKMTKWLSVVYQIATIPYSLTAFSHSVARDPEHFWMAVQCWYVAKMDSGIVHFPPVKVKHLSMNIWMWDLIDIHYFMINSASCAPDITCRVPPLHHHLRVIGLSPGNEGVNIGHKLQFICNNQDELEGPKEIQCLETGQWSNPFPTCLGMFTFCNCQR